MTDVLTQRWYEDTKRKPCEETHEEESSAWCIYQWIKNKIFQSPPKVRKRQLILPRGLEGAWPCWNFDFTLLASRIVAEDISVVLNHQFVVLRYGSPEKKTVRWLITRKSIKVMHPSVVRQRVLHQACYRHKHMESSQLSYEVSALISALQMGK